MVANLDPALNLIWVAAALLAFIPATIARRKGRSTFAWWVFGFFLFLPALIIALVISTPQVRPGDIVKVLGNIKLDDGTTIQRGWKIEGP